MGISREGKMNSGGGGKNWRHGIVVRAVGEERRGVSDGDRFRSMEKMGKRV